MSYLRSMLDWILWSSANSNKISLTLKAGIPFLVLWGVSDTETLEVLSGAVGVLLANLGQVIAGAIALWGLLRKIFVTFEEKE